MCHITASSKLDGTLSGRRLLAGVMVTGQAVVWQSRVFQAISNLLVENQRVWDLVRDHKHILHICVRHVCSP